METRKIFTEMDKAEEIGAISMTLNGNLRSEFLDRDSQIVNLCAEIKALKVTADSVGRLADVYKSERDLYRDTLDQIRTFPGTPAKIAKMVNDVLDRPGGV